MENAQYHCLTIQVTVWGLFWNRNRVNRLSKKYICQKLNKILFFFYRNTEVETISSYLKNDVTRTHRRQLEKLLIMGLNDSEPSVQNIEKNLRWQKCNFDKTTVYLLSAFYDERGIYGESSNVIRKHQYKCYMS